MSGREHYVHTGFTLIVPSTDGRRDLLLSYTLTSLAVFMQSCLISNEDYCCAGNLVESSASTTLVGFAELSQAAIEAYVATGAS